MSAENYLSHRKEQMDAIRRDFGEVWPALAISVIELCPGVTDRMLFAAKQAAWRAFVSGVSIRQRNTMGPWTRGTH